MILYFIYWTVFENHQLVRHTKTDNSIIIYNNNKIFVGAFKILNALQRKATTQLYMQGIELNQITK